MNIDPHPNIKNKYFVSIDDNHMGMVPPSPELNPELTSIPSSFVPLHVNETEFQRISGTLNNESSVGSDGI